MPGFSCVSRSLFNVFSRKNWRHFAVALRRCTTRVCWPVRPWLFKFFSMPPTRLTFNNRSADLLPAPSTSAPPFSEVFVAQLSLLRFVQRTSLPVFQCDSSPVFFPVVFFPASFPASVSSSALDVASLFSSAAGTLRLPPFCVSPQRCFYHPRLLLGPFWLGGSRLRLLRRRFFPAFLYTAKVCSESCNRRICLA